MQVDGTREVWLGILLQIYPGRSPALTVGKATKALPIIHKYNFSTLLDEYGAFLADKIRPNLEPSSPDYIISWLKLADDLHMEALKVNTSRCRSNDPFDL